VCRTDLQSPKHSAIVAVSESCTAHLIKWSDAAEDWQKESHEEFNYLSEGTFNKPIGIYQAAMTGSNCGSLVCNGYPCAGDCYEVEWTIGACVSDLKNV